MRATGALLWTATPFKNDFAMQSISAGTVAYGMLYNAGYDGYMHAINTTTGVQMWDTITSSRAGSKCHNLHIHAVAPLLPTERSSTTTTKAYEAAASVQRSLPIRLRCNHWSANMEHLGTNSQSAAIADGILIGPTLTTVEYMPSAGDQLPQQYQRHRLQ